MNVDINIIKKEFRVSQDGPIRKIYELINPKYTFNSCDCRVSQDDPFRKRDKTETEK